jgi:putative transposase
LPQAGHDTVTTQQSRLVGAVLAEQRDEWAESGRYLGFDVLGKSHNDQHPPSEHEAHPAYRPPKSPP